MTERIRSADGEELVTVDAVREAAARLKEIVLRTPLLAVESVHGASGPQMYLKPESLQPTGSFKIRGAYNAIAALPPELRGRGVVAHSSGNHAQGIARAARLLGIKAVAVMPSHAPERKVSGARRDGTEVILVGRSSEERAECAATLRDANGMTLIPSANDAAVIAGQGTIGLELVEQLIELESVGKAPPPIAVLVPVGGGGLAAGVASAVKAVRPDIAVIGVEPELAADAWESLRTGTIVRLPAKQVDRTIADGLRLTAVGDLVFAHLRRHLDGIVTVAEQEIRAAMTHAALDARLIVEPSGAVSLAGALFRRSDLGEQRTLVCVLSGGNVDPGAFVQLLRSGV
jgi:threonine dehydratase